MSDDDPYNIQINNKHTYDCVDESVIRSAVCEALSHFGVAAADVSIAVVTDDEIAELHARYSNIDGPTDVLTFDLADASAHGQDHTHIEGEIVVSADMAIRNAECRRHHTAAELALYAVHGTLHLLGMNDKTGRDAKRMHELEDEILLRAGIGRVYTE